MVKQIAAAGSLRRAHQKLSRLKKALTRFQRVLIAFSGGVDSTFLLAVARATLGKDAVLAVTAVSETYPAAERRQALNLARQLDVRHQVIHTRELSDPRFAENPADRCFHCKDHLFRALAARAQAQDMRLLDATNADDRHDYRPGRKAAAKWGVRSPLLAAQLTKHDIRALSKQLRLPTWNLPAQACLASRIPCGTAITTTALRRIERGETLLRRLCPGQLRLRHHGTVARIECAPDTITACARILTEHTAARRALRRLGWRYITLDLDGYRTGSLNPPRPGRKTDEKNLDRNKK